RRRRRDRPRREGLGREPVSDPVVVDGADAPLRETRAVLRGTLLRPRAREPADLPLPRPAPGRDHRLRYAAEERHRSREERLRRVVAGRPDLPYLPGPGAERARE